MAKKEETIVTKSIEELIEVTLRTREDSKRIKDLREKAKDEAIVLYQFKKWPIGKDMPFGKGTIRLYEETVYSWEKNHQIKDSLIELYCSQSAHLKWLEQQVKKAREALKKTAKDLEENYPNSDSIKHEPHLQIR